MGRVLGIDYGTRRIGLAVSDPTRTIAQPLPTLVRRAGKRPPVNALVQIIRDHDVDAAVIGLPLTLAGEESEWTREVRDFARMLEERATIPVHFLDERMTSVRAENAVRSLGLKRSAREQKERVDAAAAILLLQHYLDVRRPNEC